MKNSKYKNLSIEDKLKIAEKDRIKYSLLTKEEKDKLNAKIRKRRANRTIEETKLINERRRNKQNSRTNEQKEKDSKRRKDKYKNNINLKIKDNLRSRLTKALKRNQKAGSAINDLGCSMEEFKLHLERQFEPWMNWDNYGRFDLNRLTWNIDHINALANFDLTNKEEFLKACHYSNLRPLLALDNIKKGKKN